MSSAPPVSPPSPRPPRPPRPPGWWRMPALFGLGGALMATVICVLAFSGGGGNGSGNAGKTVDASQSRHHKGGLPTGVPTAGASSYTGGDASGEPSADPSAAPSADGSTGEAGTGTAGAGGAASCPTATVTVGSAEELVNALTSVAPGSVIDLADGTYQGQFSATAVGTAADPVYLCGGPGAVLDGGSTGKGYVLHIQNSAYWHLVGFTVQNGQKGVVLDHTQHSTVQGLTVHQIGDEAIHLREFSSDNLVVGNTVEHTGLNRDKFGEGVYLGTAKSNWCSLTACQPDNSDRNTVKGNVFDQTTAENVDVKEGTTGGLILDNTFNGDGITSAGGSGWINVKGNGYLIQGNTGHNSPQDGFQTHEILKGWGTGNTFKGNTADVNGPGYGFHLTPVLGNRITCDNKVQGAGKGLSNVPCTP
ncbi:right-handed parallel beta-helix repeat-containing protein [Streptacidiphilus sp. PAMC 29251]